MLLLKLSKCIAELRCKAAYFKETGLIYTLNAEGNNIVKSDSVVPADLQDGLQAALAKLRAEQADEPDWHPWTDDKVQDLVHPSLYPFVYGKHHLRSITLKGTSSLLVVICRPLEVHPRRGCRRRGRRRSLGQQGPGHPA